MLEKFWIVPNLNINQTSPGNFHTSVSTPGFQYWYQNITLVNIWNKHMFVQ